MTAALAQGLGRPGVRSIIRLIVAEAGRFPDLAEFYYRKVVARGVARGEFRPSPIESCPQLFVGPLLVGVIWQELFDRLDPLDLQGLLDAPIDALIHGIGGPKNDRPRLGDRPGAGARRRPARLRRHGHPGPLPGLCDRRLPLRRPRGERADRSSTSCPACAASCRP
jgi:hypothetical protein